MSKLQHYLSLLVFSAGLLSGVQLPNFIDQYIKRLDAHLVELKQNFAPYEAIAQRYHQGSIEALINQHLVSDAPSIRAEAAPIAAMAQRLALLRSQMQQLQGSFSQQLYIVVSQPNRAILHETYGAYSANVPLTTNAVSCALLCGIFASLVYELIISLLLLPFSKNKTLA